MNKYYSLLILLLLVTCQSQNVKDTSAEKWEDFYLKFHKDSLFQLSRIAPEFHGTSFEEDEVQVLTRENWIMLRSTVFEIDTTEYQIEFNKTDSLVSTRVYKDGTGIDIKSTFKLLDNKWYLISHINNFN